MIPELYWIQPLTWMIGIGCTAIFAYYIHITESVDTHIWVTMLGQFVVIAGKTVADYSIFARNDTTPLLGGVIMFLGGIILLATTFKTYSEVTTD